MQRDGRKAAAGLRLEAELTASIRLLSTQLGQLIAEQPAWAASDVAGGVVRRLLLNFVVILPPRDS